MAQNRGAPSWRNHHAKYPIMYGGEMGGRPGGNRSMLLGGEMGGRPGGNRSNLLGGEMGGRSGGNRSMLLGGDRCMRSGWDSEGFDGRSSGDRSMSLGGEFGWNSGRHLGGNSGRYLGGNSGRHLRSQPMGAALSTRDMALRRARWAFREPSCSSSSHMVVRDRGHQLVPKVAGVRAWADIYDDPDPEL
ncbi:unnamed protein product [Linum trigynum]|uniref:Uncharacterized protein n=1 Tax=Linum trigynum TaxID=586398 RepID=A0AAV2F4Z9_9ROSI